MAEQVCKARRFSFVGQQLVSELLTSGLELRKFGKVWPMVGVDRNKFE